MNWYIISLVIPIMMGLAVLGNWRLGFILSLIWICFEDLPRKFGGNNMALFFVKDVLIILCYASYLMAGKNEVRPNIRLPARGPFWLFAAVCFVMVFNPNSPHILYGILGLRNYFIYVPVFFLAYRLTDSEHQLNGVLLILLCTMAVISSVGVYQAVVDPTFLNPDDVPEYVKKEMYLVRTTKTGSGIVRPTSVFISAGRFGQYSIMAMFLAIGCVLYFATQWTSAKRLGVSIAVLGIIATGWFINGSRWGIGVTLIGLFLGSLLLLKSKHWHSVRQLSFFTVTGIVILMLIVILFPDRGKIALAWYQESYDFRDQSSEVYSRMNFTRDQIVLTTSFTHWLIGYGTGTFSLGKQYIERVFNVTRDLRGTENGYSSIILELGLPGIVSWLIWNFALAQASYQILKQLSNTPGLYGLGLCCFLYFVVLVFLLFFSGINPYQNYIMNVFLWFGLGLLFKLPMLTNGPDRHIAQG